MLFRSLHNGASHFPLMRTRACLSTVHPHIPRRMMSFDGMLFWSCDTLLHGFRGRCGALCRRSPTDNSQQALVCAGRRRRDQGQTACQALEIILG
ncbi:hypothetical protein F751_3949 [Auxenochlorella protothecoides]|uniref:Uncharacterized protein n=1 Tax=Auxenochlorella protothecoides TaxID=3075 RepID=A0A087SHR5_AUXPR|nr:hypothetical protein F751_3949 [Auxenochlorella protothecoides]KFM25269.1 hypothetical protein F751_3949 [Auxenochlorella protothecoides]